MIREVVVLVASGAYTGPLLRLFLDKEHTGSIIATRSKFLTQHYVNRIVVLVANTPFIYLRCFVHIFYLISASQLASQQIITLLH